MGPSREMIEATDKEYIYSDERPPQAMEPYRHETRADRRKKKKKKKYSKRISSWYR